jgi:hypothetical protein
VAQSSLSRAPTPLQSSETLAPAIVQKTNQRRRVSEVHKKKKKKKNLPNQQQTIKGNCNSTFACIMYVLQKKEFSTTQTKQNHLEPAKDVC